MQSISIEDLARSAGLETSYLGFDGVLVAADESVLRQLAATILPAGGSREADASAAPIAVVIRRSKADPQLPFGSYHLSPAAGGPAHRALVCPRQAYQLPACEAGHRLWLIAVQLYGIRSARNWGHGDFRDLADLLRLAAAQGAAGIGLNPLHALFSSSPEDCSPYSPSSRIFLNPLYIHVPDVPGFLPSDLAGKEAKLNELRQLPLMDYSRAAALKLVLLETAYQRFAEQHPAALWEEFDRFRNDQGQDLHRFAAFEALCRRHGHNWRQWPEPWRQPSDGDIEDLQKDAPLETGFYEFLQWQAHRQLDACRALGQSLNLPVGLYLDFAVGVHPEGFDVWNAPDAFVAEAQVGAPPDLLNRSGQDWGLVCFNPRTLQRTDYSAFRRALRASMRYSGALRFDHVLGINRIYLIPCGSDARNGAYLSLPMEEFLAVMASESVAEQCLLIGEDLGTVPEGFRETLSDWGLWTYTVLLFSRDESGAFQDVRTLPKRALITFNTHDLPSYAGWWTGRDIETQQKLGMILGESPVEREKARHALISALRREKLLALDANARDKPDVSAVMQMVARAPCGILSIGLDDILGMEDQQNLPGTWREYPNWRRRLPVELDALSSFFVLEQVAAAFAKEGRAWPPKE